ncbi:conserved hypothetical protein [Buchnera aphidicola str. Bp (Baizongia pistaciae)]|uniref:Sulfurtransferase TusD n=1 Tax=Buchnera aphidicola subsp. Baizongia pistaciae (strain Bp) TaxID=224915 RepID=TUSD_BUCBP|nr:sulfurtransferase complex subunit TusD [Buchnera aphidicola]Q89A62.1 RecName: Full=Sulfurtransferase TusD; AltName: Full=tRNA 2-thiouridine synthesizing protein D [Buchnera aphidicola str. Bp (Baizongia pistaciae)]AAO27181.1 conserved hypothetical protein [Buchnera aphidicola str. Bp (Baizongia pistaciae)]
MNYTVLVIGPPYSTQNSTSAFLFSRAVILNHHKLLSIFFYCDGALNANKFISPNFNECNLVEEWTWLHNKYLVKLCVCVSAALRRGVIDVVSNTKQNKNIKVGNLKSSFFLTGLGEFSNYLKISDRVIQF